MTIYTTQNKENLPAKISESIHFRTHVYFTFFFFLVFVGTTTSQNIRYFFNTLYLSDERNFLMSYLEASLVATHSWHAIIINAIIFLVLKLKKKKKNRSLDH